MPSFNKNEKFALYRPNAGSGTEDLICKVKGINATDAAYRGGVVTVVSEGLIQGLGNVVRKSDIFITCDPSGVPTAVSVVGNGAGASSAHTATIVGGEVLIKHTFAGSGTGSKIAHYCEVVGATLIVDKV